MNDPAVAEHAIRALADRKSQLNGLSKSPFVKALKSKTRGYKSLQRLPLQTGDKSAAMDLLKVSNPVADPLPSEEPTAKESSSLQSPIMEGASAHKFDVDISSWKELHLTLVMEVMGQGDHGAAVPSWSKRWDLS